VRGVARLFKVAAVFEGRATNSSLLERIKMLSPMLSEKNSAHIRGKEMSREMRPWQEGRVLVEDCLRNAKKRWLTGA